MKMRFRETETEVMELLELKSISSSSMSGYGSDLADVEIELKGNKYPHIVVGEWPVLEESCLWEEENRSEFNTLTLF